MMESRLHNSYTFFVQFYKYYGTINVIVYWITVLVMFTYSVYRHLLYIFKSLNEKVVIDLFFHIVKYIWDIIEKM